MPVTKSPSILAFGAHPDDVEIYCLGLLLRLKSLGWRIGWVVATAGQAGLSPTGEPDERLVEMKLAGESVGIIPSCLSLMDGELTDTPLSQAAVRAAIASFAPDLVITHHPDDYHPDHRALSQLVRQACGLKSALVYADTMLGLGCYPDFSVDISECAPAKHHALSLHTSQRPDLFLDDLAIWERFRAIQTFQKHVSRAEAYCFPDPYHRGKVQRLLDAVIIR
ncbi:PIG-L deacetylase family protein [Aquidulcibacter sp.]|jgi:LmbE family N-acetylglucosaminyl deacetylase|uniref:PIG-L deacetylase family protein n=1 Tax=Aquidulcibacter sp. TaxID=2052990 RepID=UPI0037BF40A8